MSRRSLRRRGIGACGEDDIAHSAALPTDTVGTPTARPQRFLISVAGSDAAFSCRTDQRVLEAMAGTLFGGPGRTARPDLRIGCRRGGCGVCRVQVLHGVFDTSPMSAIHVSAHDRAAGVALACCIYPRSDLVLQAAPKASLSTKDATRP